LTRPAYFSYIRFLSSDNSSLLKTQAPDNLRNNFTCATKQNSNFVHQPANYQVFKTTTDNLKLPFNWNLTTTSTYQIQTSSTDISNYSGADSETLIVFGSYRPLITDYELEYYSGESAESSAARANMEGYGNFINQGVKEFLRSSVSGIGARLRREFIVLDSNQTKPK
jgi:hypothetical protein